jgi:hypothetical protein
MLSAAAAADFVAACADSTVQLSDAEARVSRIALRRNHHARRAVALGLAERAAAAMKVSVPKLQQMAVAHDLTNNRTCCRMIPLP